MDWKNFLVVGLLAFIVSLGVGFSLNKTIQAGSKVEVQYPPAGETAKCAKFCSEEYPGLKLKGGILKLEGTAHGLTWACDCAF